MTAGMVDGSLSVKACTSDLVPECFRVGTAQSAGHPKLRGNGAHTQTRWPFQDKDRAVAYAVQFSMLSSRIGGRFPDAAVRPRGVLTDEGVGAVIERVGRRLGRVAGGHGETVGGL